MPDNLQQEVGHFNIFRIPPYVEGKPTRIPYRKRDIYKITLVKCSGRVHYADHLEIAYGLGFTEATHFNNFFKKHTRQSPTQFRNV